MKNIDNSPDCLRETFHLMLMTLEYGGSVNIKELEKIEKKMQEYNCEQSKLNTV